RCPPSLPCLPLRPFERGLAASRAAISLARMSWVKVLITSLEQTPPPARSAHRPLLTTPGLDIRRACRMLGRPHGSERSQKLRPSRGTRISPGREDLRFSGKSIDQLNAAAFSRAH